MDLPSPVDPSIIVQAALNAKAQQAAQHASSTDAKIEKTAQDFEAIFLNMMLKEMRKTVGEGGLLDGDAGSKIFREMMDTALAEAMAKSNTFGLGKIVAEHMKEHT